MHGKLDIDFLVSSRIYKLTCDVKIEWVWEKLREVSESHASHLPPFHRSRVRDKPNDYCIVTFVSPCHARYWRCDIEGAPNGKLHGKTIAIKDNICVAGIPMMTGSRILEGYIPDVDATVVTRILDAGGRITGKAVCESLCSSGGSFTSATGPVLHPLNGRRMTGGSSSGCGALVRTTLMSNV